MLKKAALMGLAAILGAVIAVYVLHLSRDPDTLLGDLRRRMSPPPDVLPPPPETEEAQLFKRYGPSKQSQLLEEWIVRDFFHDQRDGVFVDVGAADYKDGSNTWFLEQHLGWSGIAVDAQDHYRPNWERFRPKSKFFTLFVSDRSNDQARLFLSTKGSFVASSQRKFTEGFGKVGGDVDIITVTLNDLLAGSHVRAFDFLSMDIELSEPKALAGFDIQRFKPSLACVEAHPQVRQQILDYFAANHYNVVGKYLRVDTLNLWFMPAGASVEPFSVQPAAAQ
jgi:hypothetical protein